MFGTLAILLSLSAPGRAQFFRALPHGDLRETLPGYVKVKLMPEMAKLARVQSRGAYATEIVPRGKFVSQIGETGWTIWSVPADTNVKALGNRLEREGIAACVEPLNRVYALLDTPNDPDYLADETDPEYILIFDEGEGSFRRDWHLGETYADQGWPVFPNQWFTATNKPANTPTIAIVDSGADMSHPDFINAGGTGPDVSQGGQWKMNLSQQFHLGELDPNGTPEDANGHGTHVAGLALASGNNGSFDGRGTIGIGYNCNGMMLRIFDDQGVADDASAAAAIYYAADNGADVINLSIGTENYSQLFQDAVTYAFQKGCVVVAAGNEDGNGGGDLGPIYPAACVSALAVSANGPDQLPATGSYSGTGWYVDVAAPGGDVLTDPLFTYFIIQFVYSTAMRTEGALYQLSQSGGLYPTYHLNYAYLAGTSMASPQVAGAAGQYLGQHGFDQTDGWNNVVTFRAIESSAEGVLGAPFGGREDSQGYGCLDVYSLLTNGTRSGVQVGGIKGMLYSGGTPVPNAQVRAQKVTGGTNYSSTTHSDGSFRFESLPPGTYNVTGLAFGNTKSKQVLVKLGSDTPGQDLWIGGYAFDTTPPTIVRVQVPVVSANSITVRHWAYDTETGLNNIKFAIGSTSGADDILADKEISPDGPTFQLSGLNLTSGVTYYLRARYVNGNDATSQQVVPFSFGTGGTPVQPSSYSIFRGILQSGNLNSVLNSDDSRLSVLPGLVLNTSEAPVTVIFNGTSPTGTATGLTVRYEAQVSVGNLQQQLDLWNYTTNGWDNLDTRAGTLGDSVVTVNPTNPSRYINPTTHAMQIRARWHAVGPVLSYPWVSRTDQVGWVVTP